ncbi:unnamed protein product [Tuber aestivum]|uniref:Uncharacterized protein n=1 Tax=Tuber aestivum TaxID=59557 RepID=A0A292Q5V9_9PEZI|nr:unnamed protein product [Tuber aestivum]
MQHPIQRLLYVPETSTLYTCTGPHIHSFNARIGESLAKWTAPAAVRQVKKKKGGKNNGNGGNVAGKKRKSGDEGVEGEEEVKDTGEEEGEEEEDVEGEGSDNNNSSRIISARAGKYIVTVTNEDKAVRVLDGDGLAELSSRIMPKRPCALALTDSDTTILVADKFGDVYSLPLLLSPEAAPAVPPATTPKDSGSKRHRTEIIHDLPFAHKLLLGHVSMLTDLLSVTTTTREGQKRKYIITADRDEHIRVSRYPQSWVIEGFCLGHTAFVSKVLVPGWAPQEVISGGGDVWLGRWRWADGKCLQRIEVARVLEEIVGRKVAVGKEGGDSGSSREGTEGQEGGYKVKEEVCKPAVVGIWEVPERKAIIVAFERIPALILFATQYQALTHHTTIPLPGNPLDLTVDPTSSSFWVSLAPSSTTATSDFPLLQHITLAANNEWENTTKGDKTARAVSEEISKVRYVGDVKILNEGLLYTTGSLRKGFGKDKE